MFLIIATPPNDMLQLLLAFLCTLTNKKEVRRKQSSGMWHRVDVVLTDVSEERIASIFRVEGQIRKSELEKTVRTGTTTRCHIPEDCFFHSHRRENLKSYRKEVICLGRFLAVFTIVLQ